MTQPPSGIGGSSWRRLRRPVAVSLGVALLATGAGCTGSEADRPVGGGPAGTPTASPPKLVPSGSATPRRADRPNIVTIVTDDMRTDDLRWMPHVRQLVGERGLEFRNSFSAFPLCAPARSSLLTGQYAHNTGVLDVSPPENYEAFDDRATVATSMNAAGYNTVFMGKYMNGYGDGPSKVTGKNSFRYVPPGWTDWWGAPQRPANSTLRGGGTYNYFHLLLNHNGRLDDTHKGTYQTVVQGRILRRMVAKYHRSPKPFFLYYAPIAPHFGAPREDDDPSDVVRPGTSKVEKFKTPARPGRVRGLLDDRIRRASGLPQDGSQSQRDMSGLPRPMRNLPRISDAERAAMLTLTRQRAESLHVLDVQIGKLIDKLKTTGEYDDTVVMFTSDNGYFLGEHRMRQGKIWAHEPSLRVPFLVAGPGVPRGTRFDPVRMEDIAATVLALGGAGPPRPADGLSLVPSFRRDRGWRVPILLEGNVDAGVMNAASKRHPPGFPNSLTGTGIRTAEWKYMRYVDGDAELYHLTRDPNELRNLYDRPRYADVQRELADLWRRYRQCAGASCRAPMPQSLQLGARRLAEVTRTQERRVDTRYGVPAL